MKKVFLLLSAGVLLVACNSGYQPDGADTARTAKEPVAPAATPLNADSTADSRITAVSQQPQVDTSMTHLGTSPTGTPASAGGKLLAASDCGSCHREKEKLLGPAYVAVAQKYPDTPANVAMLAKHIIMGGAGHWGDIPMTPHPGLSETDAKQMAQYILAMK